MVYRKNYEIFLFFILLIFAIYGLYSHEIWRDEGQHIQISTELTFLETINYSRYEGLIPFYSMILEFLNLIFRDKIFSLKFFNFVFFIITAFVLLNKKNLPFNFCFLILCSYPILCNYFLVSRIYIMLVPSIFYLLIYDKKSTNMILLNMTILSLTGIFGMIINFCYLISNIKFFKNLIIKKNTFFLFFFFISLLSFFYILPLDNREWNELRIPSFYELGTLLYKIIYSLTFIHDLSLFEEIWDRAPSSFLIKNFINLIAPTLLFLSILNLYLKNEKKLILILILSFCIFFIFFSITTHHSFKHYFLLFIIFTAINIKAFFSSKEYQYDNFQNFYKFLIYFLVLALLISSLTALYFWNKVTNQNIYNLLMISSYFLTFITCCLFFFKKKFFSSHMIMLFFLIYFIYFSLYPNYFLSYKIYLLINLILSILIFKILILDHETKFFFNTNYNLIGKYFFLLSLVISTIGSLTFFTKDIFLKFSNSKDLGKFILKQNINCENISVYPDWTTPSWATYINKKCMPYSIKNGHSSGFVNLNLIKSIEKDNYNNLTENDILIKKVIILSCQTNCQDENNFLKKYQSKFGGKILLFNNQTLLNSREKFIIYNRL